MSAPLPASLIGKEVTLQLLAPKGTGAKVCGVLERRSCLGYVTYAVTTKVNGKSVGSVWFRLSSLDRVTEKADGPTLWVK